MTNDFATVVYRMKLLGFNAIRIPFRCARKGRSAGRGARGRRRAPWVIGGRALAVRRHPRLGSRRRRRPVGSQLARPNT